MSANKISPNVEKSVLVIFKSPRKVLLDEIKISLSGKNYPSNSVKYLGIKIDRFLHWHEQVNSIPIKLNIAIALLLKIRNYVNTKTLRNIYFAIFHFHLSYLYIAWAQNFHTVSRLFIVQKKALRIINFKDQLFHSSLRLFSNNILKFGDKTTLEDIIFVSKSINRQAPSVLYDWFIFSEKLQKYETCWSVTNHLNILTIRSQKYGPFIIRASAIRSWNYTQDK